MIFTEAHHKYQFKLHAYCLMNNHFHLLIQSATHSPSKIMQTILQRYSSYFNRTYQTQGHVFQDGFHAVHVDQENYFLNVSKYIHLNPVVAGMVAKPEDYQWSSYNSYIKNTQRVIPLSKQPRPMPATSIIRERCTEVGKNKAEMKGKG